MFKILSTYICWKKNIKCNIWRVAVRPSYIQDARFLKVKQGKQPPKRTAVVFDKINFSTNYLLLPHDADNHEQCIRNYISVLPTDICMVKDCNE
jgi:hypothetical protein